MRGILPRVKPGDPIYAEDWNTLVEKIETLLNAWTAGSGLEFVQNASGIFFLPPRSKTFSVYRVSDGEELIRSVPAGATRQKLEDDEWVDVDATVTMQGDFFTGVAFAGDLVLATRIQNDWYALGSGRVFVRGVLESDLAPNGSATLRLIEEPASGIGYNSQDHTINVRERLGDGGTVVSGSRVYANWDEYDQIWIATGAACS